MLRAIRIPLLIVLFVLMTATLTVNAQQSVTPTVSNVFYAGEAATSDLLDVYVPDGGSAPYPVVVMFTTSSGEKGDLTDPDIPQFVIGQGYAAVTVGYRTPLPDVYADAFCALAWVYANAQQYHLDTSRIALYGVSWGGTTSAFIAGTGDPTPYLTNCPNSLPADHSLRGVITDSGAFLTVPDEIVFISNGGLIPKLGILSVPALRQLLNPLRTTSPDQWHTLQLPDNLHTALENFPILQINSHEPPFLIVQGLVDKNVPYQDALNFTQALLEQGVSVQLVFDPPSGHGVDLSIYQDEMALFLKHIFA